MKVLAAALCLGSLAAPAVTARQRWQKFQATAYSQEGQTASGKITREGRTVAADPAVLPVGTRIQVAGAGAYSGVYVVQGSGRKIDGHEIDLFIDNPVEAKRFGKRPVRVRILQRPKPQQEATR